MDFDYKIDKLESEINSLSERLNDLKNEYNQNKDFTAVFLDVCKKYKITKVSISRKHKSTNSLDFPFNAEGSIFSNNVRVESWPAIWKVVEELGIGYGGGNSNQHQANCSKLVDGVYHFKNGIWLKMK